MPSLTKRQREIYDFIVTYIEKNGLSPTIEEIGKNFGLRAPSTVHQHLNTLKEKGYLSKDDNLARSISPRKEMQSIIRIPVLGRIAAGQPLEVFENAEDTVSLVNASIKNVKDYYALKVVGDSMIEDGIFDGDIVIIKRQSVAENGQTVVAIIDENEATLKKIYREKGRFRLQPANQALLPIYRSEVEIRGIVFQVIRNIKDSPQRPIPEKTKQGLKTLDLFAGIGGIRIGFERAGFETVFSNDFDEPCRTTYNQNFQTAKLVVEDMRKIGVNDLPKFDFLLGGFPCQAFSIAGYRQGFNDEKGRGNLFFDIIRILKAHKPTGFLLENVKNLKSHDGGRTFEIIEKELKALGYHIKSHVLNSMYYGNIPQNRERIYIVGFRNKKHHDNFEFPKPIKRTVKITDILEKNVHEKYYYNDKPLYQKLVKDIKEPGKVYQWRRQYVRENKSGVCPTLTANMGMGGHNVPIIKDKKGIRKLTPRECARIQGFPDTFQLPKNLADSALYKQIGNSVSIPVVEAVAKAMKRAMECPI